MEKGLKVFKNWFKKKPVKYIVAAKLAGNDNDIFIFDHSCDRFDFIKDIKERFGKHVEIITSEAEGE